MADTQKEPQTHALPAWTNWVQQNLLLTFLLLAEAYLLGDLMQRGWVSNVEDIGSWGVYHGVGVVLFFAAGATAAGIALRCSAAAAYAFQCRPRRVGMGLFNMLGLIAFGVCEIWASLSERSANLAPTPADKVVLEFFHIDWIPVSPTVVIVALLLPFATLYSGFSQTPKAHVETVEEMQARMQREIAMAQHKAALGKVNAGGLAARARAFGQGITGQQDEPQPEANEDDSHPDNGSAPTLITTRKKGERAPSTTPRNLITAPQLKQWLADELQVTISDDEALNFIKAQASRQRLEGAKGLPWVANKAATLQRARAVYAAANTSTEQAL